MSTFGVADKETLQRLLVSKGTDKPTLIAAQKKGTVKALTELLVPHTVDGFVDMECKPPKKVVKLQGPVFAHVGATKLSFDASTPVSAMVKGLSSAAGMPEERIMITGPIRIGKQLAYELAPEPAPAEESAPPPAAGRKTGRKRGRGEEEGEEEWSELDVSDVARMTLADCRKALEERGVDASEWRGQGVTARSRQALASML